jgi:hypothetical protein
MRKYSIMVCLLALTFGCKKRDIYTMPRHYIAINNNDTAHLRITEGKTEFYGSYEILYGRSGKDSGDIRGLILKDTFRGVHTYTPYGGGPKKSVPFIALKKDGQLLLGKGVPTSYMNVPYYAPSVPIDYSEPKFVFKEMAD